MRKSILTIFNTNVCRAAIRLLFIAVMAVSFGASAKAAEEPVEFLEGLRERGLFDYALLYLEQAPNNRLIGDEFKQSVPFELAATKVGAANASSNQGEREAKLLDAIQDFVAFQKANPKHSRANTVDLQVGNIYVMLGKTRAIQMQRDGEDKPARQAEALKFFDDGLASIEKAKVAINKELKELPANIPQTNRKLTQRRDELRRDNLKTRLLLAAVMRERALAYEPESKEFTEAMKAAAESYKQLFIDHRRRLAGLFARLQEGRCYLDLGKPDDAMRCFYELMDQDESVPTLRNLKVQSIKLAMEASIELKEYKEAIGMADLITLRRGENKQPDFLGIGYHKALASKRLADTLDKKKFRGDIVKLNGQAKDLATSVSRVQSEYRSDAIKLLGELGKNVAENTGDPTNFSEALSRATNSRTAWLAAKGDAAKKEGEEQEKALELANKSRTEAFDFYRLALSLADEETSQAGLNETHYFLCYLYWDSEDYPKAAVLGRYLAENFPDFSGSKSAGTIAMASWLKMYGEAEDKEFETGQVIDAAEFMVERWPNEPEAADAYVTLVNFAIVGGRSDEALAYLEKLPEGSSKRGDLAIKIGQTLWQDYLKETRKEAEAGRLADEELTALEAKAREVLVAGVTRAQASGQVDKTVANAVISLVQLYADSSQPVDAIRWLEDEKIGALTLVNGQHAAAQHEPYAEETLKVALRSYVSVLPELAGDQPAIDATNKKADQVMDQLEKTFGANQAERLTKIYISMGKNLETQMNLLNDDPSKKRALAQSFEKFLSRIGGRKEGNSFQSLTWVAETFYGLGESFSADGTVSKEAKDYYEKAVANYNRILERVAKDPKWAPDPKSVTGIQMRLANCYSQLGQLDKATDRFLEILKAKQGNLTAQIDAAYVLQRRGVEDSNFYKNAIAGYEPIKGKRGSYYIWGWSKVAKLTAGNEKFAKYFHEASLQSIACRYELALTLKGEKKRELLNVAKRALDIQTRRFPKLGGDEWKAKYNALLKDIQRGLGQPIIGLKEFESKKAS